MLKRNLINYLVKVYRMYSHGRPSLKGNIETVWNPLNILSGKNNSGFKHNYAIMVLNTQIKWVPEILLPLWTKANLRFTVDGGTNQWYKWMEMNQLRTDTIPSPNFVTGDMDSIDVKFLEILRDERKSSVIVTDDQSETDFTKALKELVNVVKPSTSSASNTLSKPLENVIAVVDTSGRLDQIMANINTLYKSKTILGNTNLYQLSNDSLSWLINPGRHKIYIPDKLREDEVWCALIPVGEECKHVTTTGLKWDLNDKVIKFGELVSTSNTYSDLSPYISIETDKTLLWSMGLQGISIPPESPS